MKLLSFDDLPIKRKLLVMSLLSTGAALLLFGSSFLLYDLLSFRKSLVNRLESYADIIGYNSTTAILFNDAQAADRTLQALKPRSSIVAAAIYSANGELFAGWSRQTNYRFPLFPNESAPRFSPDGVGIFHPVISEGIRVGTVYLLSDLSDRAAQTTNWRAG